jgi:radical SAM protein with 4Fe4S-binding SPASM domain
MGWFREDPSAFVERVSAIFREVLFRPPDEACLQGYARQRRKWLHPLTLRGLRAELLRSPERTQVVEPLLDAVREARVELPDGVTRDEVTVAVLDRFRRRYRTFDEQREALELRPARRCQGRPEDVLRRNYQELLGRQPHRHVKGVYLVELEQGLMSEEQLRQMLVVERAWRETLWRDPDRDRGEVHQLGLENGRIDEETVRAELRETVEYREVIEPILREAHRAYDWLTGSEPTRLELQDCVDRFRTRFPDLDAQIAGASDPRLHCYLGIRPLKLELDLTTQCNLRCTMCYFSLEEFSKRKRVDISVEAFERVAEQILPACATVSLSIGTEPLLHKDFLAILDIVGRYEVPWTYMATNGLLLTEAIAERMIDVGFKGFAISIDAATAQTYERIRGGSFERLVKNIELLQAAKKRRGTEFPLVTFNYVLMRSNVDELPELVELGDRLGVDGIAAMHITPFKGLDMNEESLVHDKQRCNERVEQARALACERGIGFAVPPPFATEEARPAGSAVSGSLPSAAAAAADGSVPDSVLTAAPIVTATETVATAPSAELAGTTPMGFKLNVDLDRRTSQCTFPWHFVGIDPYGNVMPCGWWYTEKPMGNIHEQPFEAIWNSDAFRKLREEHVSGNLRTTCRNCPAAGMGSVDHPSSFVEVTLGSSPG